MAKTKEITGCTILNPLTPAGAMRAMKMLTEMRLKSAGLTAEITPRLRKPGETAANVPKGTDRYYRHRSEGGAVAQ